MKIRSVLMAVTLLTGVWGTCVAEEYLPPSTTGAERGPGYCWSLPHAYECFQSTCPEAASRHQMVSCPPALPMLKACPPLTVMLA